MKRRIVLVLIFGIFLGMIIDNINMKNIKLLKNDISSNNNDISIMVYDDTLENYVRSDSVPIGDYELNEDASYCINGGSISNYDNINGTLEYTFPMVDECYVYFDRIIIKPIITYFLFSSLYHNPALRVYIGWDWDIYDIKYVYIVYEGVTYKMDANSKAAGQSTPYYFGPSSGEVCGWNDSAATIKSVTAYIEDVNGTQSESVYGEQTVGNIQDRADC